MGTPKAMLHQLYPCNERLRFETESLLVAPKDGDAQLITASDKGRYFPKTPRSLVSQFRCTLSLPSGVTVVSDLFNRKREAEQDASKRALDLMNVQPAKSIDVLSLEEKWSNLQSRIETVFTDKNVGGLHPLREHFKAAVKRDGARYGQVPLCAIATLDERICRLCKAIDPRAEADLVHRMALVGKAASECKSIKIDEDNLCLSRSEPFPTHVIRKLVTAKFGHRFLTKENQQEVRLQFTAVLIPCDVELCATALDLTVTQDEYFLDVIAGKLGVKDSGRVLFSKVIGKTRPFMRIYWPAPETLPQVQGHDSNLVNFGEEAQSIVNRNGNDLRRYSADSKRDDGENGKPVVPLNVRASLLVGFSVCGEAILAAVGGDWASQGKVYSSSVKPSTFHRMLLQGFPHGNYKVSRDAIFASKLPDAFSGAAQWRGKLPQCLLSEFCLHHQLPEPVFAVSRTPPNEPPPPKSDQSESDAMETESFIDLASYSDHGANACSGEESNALAQLQCRPFTCKVRVEWIRSLVVEFESYRPHADQQDAQECAALRALHHLDTWFEESLIGRYEPEPTMFIDPNRRVDQIIEEHVHHPILPMEIRKGCCWESADSEFFNSAVAGSPDPTGVFRPQMGKIPPLGSMVTVRYTVRWFNDTSDSSLLEKDDNFEFELGSGAVWWILDTLTSRMCVGETACITTSTPPSGLFYTSTCGDSCENRSPSFGDTKYTLQLIDYVESLGINTETKLSKSSTSTTQRIKYVRYGK